MKIMSRYRRMFFSKRSAVLFAILVFILCAATIALGTRTGQLKFYDYFDHALRLIMTAFLFYGYLKNNLLAMQAGICGLLVSLVYYQASYLNGLFDYGSNYFMTLGFWGSFFLACQIMVLILEFFFMMNHFETFILKKRNFLRVAINQISIAVLIVFLIFLLFVISKLMTSFILSAYFTVYILSLIAAYMLIGCCELVLTIDSGKQEE